ncbi:MAG: AbrB/MazE/SpoVT family DNA-binding domain-containing protein [Archangium sp.]
MKTTISSKGQLVLPGPLRERDGIVEGDEFEVVRLSKGKYRLSRVKKPGTRGVVDWLLACPEKGYFTPIDSESTDSL